MSDSSNRLSGLLARPKKDKPQKLYEAEKAGEDLGFVDRSPRRKPGRKPSSRTYQLHPKVLPEIGQSIAEEAIRRGVTQGYLIELMWKKYSGEE